MLSPMQTLKPLKMLTIDRQTEKFDFAQLPRMVLVFLCFSPFLEGDLDIFVGIDSHEVSIFVAISQSHGSFGDGVVRESSNLCVNTVGEGSKGDIECDYKSNIIPITVDLDLQLGRKAHVTVARHSTAKWG